MPSYEINIYNGDTLIFSESTSDSSKTILQFLVQVPMPHKEWYTFDCWVWNNDVEVDPSMTVAQAANYLGTTTINIYAKFIPLEEIECIIFNWVEFWFTVNKDWLARVATTNEYSDLDWLPPALWEWTLILKQDWAVRWRFNANSSEDVEVTLSNVAWYFENITYTKYRLWKLIEVVADGETYYIDYIWWRVKSITGGGFRYDVTYSGKYLESVTKTVYEPELIGPEPFIPIH